MKKITQLFLLLCLGFQVQAFNDSPVLDSVCNVTIQMDSLGTGVILTAMPDGQAPFAYSWSSGENTQTVTVTSWNQNYCVTVTDADGCVATSCLWNNPPSCNVSVELTPVGALVADASGTGPFTYMWTTGEFTQDIFPTSTGNYCVTTTDAAGCTASDCYWFAGNGGNDTCSVSIEVDSANVPNMVTLIAIPGGEAPFTYQWNVQNWQTQSITVPATGEYCVVITAADGCVATACINLTNNGGCSVTIGENPAGSGDVLTAYANASGNVLYMWSTGEPTQSITPNGAGEYCVTVTFANGCTASDCYDYDPFQGTQIQGYVYLPDSLNPLVWQGIAELYSLTANGDFALEATVDLENIPNGWGNYYDFGNVAAGQYLVKITVDPNDPISPDYLPTYHVNTVFWDEATIISIPSNQTYYNVTMDDGLMLTGPGTIDGLVTEGDGLKGGDDNRGPGDPMEGVSVLLFDATENTLTHTVTDVNGEYSFSNLPLGTYKIMVEIVGLDQTERWVTLTTDEPAATGIDFEVTESGIVNGIAELVSEQDFSVYPNPATSEVTLRVNASANFEAQLTLSALTGTTVFAQHTNLTAGEQAITLNLNDLPSGVYFLQLTTGREVISRKVVKQ